MWTMPRGVLSLPSVRMERQDSRSVPFGLLVVFSLVVSSVVFSPGHLVSRKPWVLPFWSLFTGRSAWERCWRLRDSCAPRGAKRSFGHSTSIAEWISSNRHFNLVGLGIYRRLRFTMKSQL